MKKLLNKKGSVLFLVVVVMSILLVVASATYYIVSNQRQSVEVHYNSEQSYQTAYSVSKTVENFITQENNRISNGESYENTIFGKIKTLPLNGTMNAAKDLEALGLGKFDVTITKTDEDGDEMSFEVTTTSKVNGESTKLIQVWTVVLSEKETKYFTRFLTSTGLGTGTDTFLWSENIYGDNYFENAFTTFDLESGLHRSVYSTGTIIDKGIKCEDMQDEEMVIQGNYYLESNYKDKNVNRIFVGGNFVIGNGQQTLTANAVYVMGDFVSDAQELKNNNPNTTYFIYGDCYVKSGKVASACNLYVEGNLYWDGNWDTNGGEVHVNKSIYYGGSGLDKVSSLTYGENLFDKSGNPTNIDKAVKQKTDIESVIKSVEAIVKTEKDDLNFNLSTWTNIANYISNETAVGKYQTWDALSLFEKATAEKPAGKFANKPTFDIGQEINNTANSSTRTMSGKPGEDACTKVNTVERNQNGYTRVTIRETCKYLMPVNKPADRFVLVIDATDEDIYIYLDPNGKDYFQFYPISPLNVLIKGSHSVIFVLPENITFRMNDGTGSYTFIGHYEIAKKLLNLMDASKDIDRIEDITDISLSNPGGIDGLRKLFSDESDQYLLKTITKTKGKEVEQYTFLDDAKFGGNAVHNNIFLVSRGANQFDFKSVCTLAGYVYAPKTTLEIEASGNHMKFFGGLIVGGFKYSHKEGMLAFCSPYDPYNTDGSGNIIGENVVSNLISQASGGVISGGPSSTGEKQVKVTFEGYK